MTPDITAGSVWSRIPKRGRESNKGSFGAVLAVAGSACYRAATAAITGSTRRAGDGGGSGPPAGMLSLPL